MESTRQHKIARLIQKDLSDIFLRYAKRIGNVLISVSEVRVSPDLSVASVYLSIFPDEREKELKIIYDGVELKQTYRADFVCYGKIILELKAVSGLDDTHRAQVYNYLHATGMKLGLLLNFGNSEELEKMRIVL